MRKWVAAALTAGVMSAGVVGLAAPAQAAGDDWVEVFAWYNGVGKTPSAEERVASAEERVAKARESAWEKHSKWFDARREEAGRDKTIWEVLATEPRDGTRYDYLNEGTERRSNGIHAAEGKYKAAVEAAKRTLNAVQAAGTPLTADHVRTVIGNKGSDVASAQREIYRLHVGYEAALKSIERAADEYVAAVNGLDSWGCTIL